MMPSEQQAVPVAQEVPGEGWSDDWKAFGFNGAIRQAQEALRFLANNDRPSGGEQFPNSACCYMIADELEITRKRYAALSHPCKSGGGAGECAVPGCDALVDGGICAPCNQWVTDQAAKDATAGKREPMAHLGKGYTVAGVLAEMLAVGTADDEGKLAEDWPLDCRTDVDRWQAVIRLALTPDATQTREAELVAALEFYADRDSDGYRVDVTNYGLSTEEGEIVRDGGALARAALNARGGA